MTTVHTHVAEMHFPAIRTAVRAHSGNRWVGFLEGIDAQKLSWSTRCKTILNSGLKLEKLAAPRRRPSPYGTAFVLFQARLLKNVYCTIFY